MIITGSMTKEMREKAAELRKQVPLEKLKAIKEEMNKIGKSGQADGLKEGNRAPDFTLPNHKGDHVNLYDNLKDGPVILSFYRGSWCTFCNIELKALQQYNARFEEKGAKLIAVCPEKIEGLKKSKRDHGIDFQLLSDGETKVSEEYKLLFEFSDRLKKIYKDLDIDLKEYNANGLWTLPVPATFVIDTDGTIKSAYVEADYTKRMDPEEIVEVLNKIRR